MAPRRARHAAGDAHDQRALEQPTADAAAVARLCASRSRSPCARCSSSTCRTTLSTARSLSSTAPPARTRWSSCRSSTACGRRS
eukprot:5300924-Prymnesium_polylepis.1